MTKCQVCQQNPATHSAIVNGVYYKNVCEPCRTIQPVSSGHARWNRTIDMEDHEHEVQQPYNSDGSINSRFVKMYPKQAKALFSDKQMRDANFR